MKNLSAALIVGLLLLACLAWSNFGMWTDPGYGNIEIANDMRQLGLALHNYSYSEDALPPARITDYTGRPLHSWRVLLLPFLEQQELFDQYNFDQPWDSPENLKVASRLQVPLFSLDQPTMATYKVVCGPGTAFPPGEVVRLSDVKNDPIVLVEDTQHPILWSQPDDLSLEEVVKIFDRQNNADGLLHIENSLVWQRKKYNSFVATLEAVTEYVTPMAQPSELQEHFLVNHACATPFDELSFEGKATTSELTSKAWIALAISFGLVLGCSFFYFMHFFRRDA